MLTREDNEQMCRVGPGTAMGTALRHYWWPVLLSEEVSGKGRSCTPRPVRLMGERLVAFRGEDGAVRLVAEACPHRGASLVLGVVEDCAIRCLYHGWKIAGDGEILDAPNVSQRGGQGGPLRGFRGKGYPVREAGGIIWTYLGPSDVEPPFMDYYWFSVPADQRWISQQIIDANYVQVVEGSLDPTHFGILHRDSMVNVNEIAADGATTNSVLGDLAPKIQLTRTDYGFVLYTSRAETETHMRVRPTVFVAPSTMVIPTGTSENTGGMIIVTPIDDYRSMQIFLRWDDQEKIGLEPHRSDMQAYFGVSDALLESMALTRSTCDRPGKPSMINAFYQDRAAIAAGRTATGLQNFVPEDVAMTVSQGPIADRSEEHLVKADIGCVELRRLLLDTAKCVAAGQKPVGLAAAIDHYELCSREYLVENGQPPGKGAPRNIRLSAVSVSA
ncbi:MAG: (2Fe-2S)-binding protein [Bradyrhizobium sp.]|nr:(2Fe-2S)-binding protein [Bradyrhizobium sp.]